MCRLCLSDVQQMFSCREEPKPPREKNEAEEKEEANHVKKLAVVKTEDENDKAAEWSQLGDGPPDELSAPLCRRDDAREPLRSVADCEGDRAQEPMVFSTRAPHCPQEARACTAGVDCGTFVSLFFFLLFLYNCILFLRCNSTTPPSHICTPPKKKKNPQTFVIFGRVSLFFFICHPPVK